jgi:hypothetical protein
VLTLIAARRRRRRGRHRRSRRSIFNPGPIAHPRRGVRYYLVDSIRGLIAARRAHKQKADRDLQMTSDWVVVVCHDDRPLAKFPGEPGRGGFHDPEGVFGPGFKISEHTWEEVARLRTPDNHRISTLTADLEECGRLGIEPILEPKGNPRFHDPHHAQQVWDGIATTARHAGVRRMSGYALPANAAALPFMNRAGIPSHELSHHHH